MRVGYFLSCEEFGPAELVRQAKLAEQAGFDRLWISDHFHPWLDQQGSSPFVWSVIGALSEATSLPIGTAVTCPTIRIHPAIVAQAAATAGVQTGGRFILGLGTGEAVNEHVLGDRWPPPEVRTEMLSEAIDVLRRLFSGRKVNHHGRHYTVENARLYTVPDEPVPVHLSAFGPKAARLAGEIADGLICPMPDPDMLAQFRDGGGVGKPVQGGMKACWAETEDAGVDIAHLTWSNELLPGALALNLPQPADFEQAAPLAGKDSARQNFACGPDAERHIQAARTYVDAGFDELYVHNIGPNQEEFFRLWSEQVLPSVRG